MMSWQEMVDTLIDATSAALEVGDWATAVNLTVDLYTAALHSGETEFAELVQDLHWIANDALMHPLEVERMMAP